MATWAQVEHGSSHRAGYVQDAFVESAYAQDQTPNRVVSCCVRVTNMQGRIDDNARTPTAYEPEPRYKNRLPYALARLLRQCSCVVGPEVEQGALLDLVTCFVVTHCEDSRLQAVIAKAGELWHRRNVGENTKRVMRERKQANLPTGGPAPYGWHKTDDGRLERDPKEQECIALVRSLRFGGRSLRSICLVLAKRGYVNREGRKHYPTSIARMLKGQLNA